MGQHKSKVIQERHLQETREERRKRRKWRKKQGYSLPTGLDTVGISAASSHTDLPDLDQDDAVLVSYRCCNLNSLKREKNQVLANCNSFDVAKIAI